MKHEIITLLATRPITHPTEYYAACNCLWVGVRRQSETAARIDGKQHRLETVVEDDRNRRKTPA
jgi:hypothetical protein